jgi:transmembrane sensor
VKRLANYSVSDFVQDDRFIKWINEPNEELHSFWTEFLQNFPDKSDEISEARRIVEGIRMAPIAIDDDGILNLKHRILKSTIQKEVVHLYVQKNDEIKPRQRVWWYAAAVLLVATCISFFFLTDNRSQPDSVVEVKEEITMDHLEKQVIPKGKRSLITLADGTTVWLNADTKLEYGKDFNTKATRDVYLKGEAFFDVAEDKDHPFIVHTQNVSIKVLGTSFNVKAYESDQKIETTLVKGKVIVENRDRPETVKLTPNQRAVFNKKSRKLVIEENVGADDYTQWKNGVLNFEGQPIREILPVLERWFNVTIHTEQHASLDCEFTAKINNKSLEEVLELFKSSDTFSYRIEGREFCD